MARSAGETSNQIVVGRLRELAEEIEDATSADLLAYSGPMLSMTPDLVKVVVERRKEKRRRRRVVVWLETNGGFVEGAERTASILRHHYRVVDYVVTTYAMSAGTILVMSGDSITMDYSATLGPIDPQIARSGSGGFVPALGYLEQYERLVEKSARGDLTSAELAYLIQKFDPAELYQFEQARDLSIALLEEWLVKYKFKNWKTTAGSGRRVTLAMKRERAVRIAEQLNDTSEWHSHGRGISMDVLRRKLNLQIEDVEDTPELADKFSRYTALFDDFRRRMGHELFAIASADQYHGH